MSQPRFHLALPVKDIKATRQFYEGKLQCRIGRYAYNWIDVDFYGHQITFQVRPKDGIRSALKMHNGSGPIVHFGIVLSMTEWRKVLKTFKAADFDFMIEPGVVMAGEAGEQSRFFVADPDGYGIEFKAFPEDDAVFRT